MRSVAEESTLTVVRMHPVLAHVRVGGFARILEGCSLGPAAHRRARPLGLVRRKDVDDGV